MTARKLANVCAWFALCDRPAVTTVQHPILGAVPCCARCAAFATGKPGLTADAAAEYAQKFAHFTLDGRPLCACQYPANYDRIRAAGSPACESLAEKQIEKLPALAAQFPNRVALVMTRCPERDQ